VLDLAFLILCAAVLSGSALAILYVRGARLSPPHKAVPPLHGALGAAGLLASRRLLTVDPAALFD
jgi:hypothetical protein